VSLALPVIAAAEENCPNAALRSGPSLRLPDCRAYEMVTPPYQEGFPTSVTAVSEDGSRVVGESFGVFAGAENDYFNFGSSGGPDINNESTGGEFYAFLRGQSGWVASAIGPPASRFPEYVLPRRTVEEGIPAALGSVIQPVTPGKKTEHQEELAVGSNLDLAESVFVAETVVEEEAQAVEGAKGHVGDFYVRKAGGPLESVGSVIPPSVRPAEAIESGEREGKFFTFEAFRGASAGVPSALFYSMRKAHWLFDYSDPGTESLYEYRGVGSAAPLLVGVSGGVSSTSLISACGTMYNGSSETGERVLFTAAACGSSPSVGELWVREDNGQPGARSVAISEPSVEDCSLCDTAEGVRKPAVAMGFSSDGSKVFFTTSQPLLGEDTSKNLYEYDFDRQAGSRVVRISGGDSTVSNPIADVESVVGASPDGSHVYFTASGVLTKTPNGLGEEAKAGQSNLYVYERDAQYPNGRIEFVVPWADADTFLGSLFGQTERSTITMSGNGRFVVFDSIAHLTADDLSSIAQAFEYDAQAGSIVRVSIGQDGYNSDGNNASAESFTIGPNPNLYTPNTLLVADDGAVFFNSYNPLVPQAVNGSSNGYEYREGTVSMITDGEDLKGSAITGISVSGGDVFFHTLDRLVPRDTNSQVDVYDARVDGGFAEPPPPPSCQADACQGALSAAPVLLSPASEFQAGAETLEPAVPVAQAPKAGVKGKPKAKRKKTKLRGKGRKARKAGRASRRARSVAGGIGGRR
jgi:hypothetical protein